MVTRITKKINEFIEPFFPTKEFIDWDDYRNKIGFLDEHNFRQKTRRIRRLGLI